MYGWMYSTKSSSNHHQADMVRNIVLAKDIPNCNKNDGRSTVSGSQESQSLIA